MTYITAQARQELLDSVAEAADELGAALAALGGAYEQLDPDRADELEDALFRPVQSAYGRAKKTCTDFAGRHAVPAKTFAAKELSGSPKSSRDLLEGALDHVEQSEAILSELQDSMLPVEVGDPEIRAGIAEVRGLIADASLRGERFLRLLGR